MREEVAVREWCLEKALEVEHLNSSRTLKIARQFEAYITKEPVSIDVEFKDVAYVAYSDGTWGKLETTK